MTTPPKDTSNMGRPTVYREAMNELVLEVGRDGGDVAEMAVACDVCIKTLYNMAESNNDFLQSFMKAQTIAQAIHSKRLRKGLDLPAAEFQGAANLKYMGQRFHQTYGENLNVNLNAKVATVEVTPENAQELYSEMLGKPAT